MQPVGGLACARGVRPLGEKRLGRPIAYELREALVERRRAPHVQRVVRDLVEYGRGQLHRVARQRRREQRVVEPAQRREGRRRPEVDVVALGREPATGPPRRFEIEEALVRDPAHDRILPGIRADAVLGRGLEHQQKRIATDVGVGRVGLLGLQPHRGRIVAALEHQPQRLPHGGIGGAVGHQLGDRLPGLEDPGLLDAGPGDVPDVVAREVRGPVAREDGGDHDEKDHSLHRRRRRMVRGATSGERAFVSSLVSRRSSAAPDAACSTSTCCPEPARRTPVRM